MFFCAIVIVQQESFLLKISKNPQEVIFVLPGGPSDWWMEENELLTHWSAWDWSFLFEDETTNQQSFTPTTSTTDAQINVIHNQKDYLPGEKDIFSEDEDVFYEWENDWNISDINIEDKDNLTQQNSGNQNSFQICITPWWEYVAHGDFVLAYEQRKDVDNLCNVQRRFCFDWKLNWTYNQKSCKENTVYSYVKPEAISYTQKPVDTFVQPKPPSLSWADFDTHWKIDWTTNPIDVWWSPGSGRPVDTSFTSQTSLSNNVCSTPWWEKIKNGQFVKAYKTSVGLIDLPCDVELRMCANWNLKGSYTHRTCTFKKMTYRDYISDNYNLDNPTIWDLINTIDTDEEQTTYKNRLFWKWLDKYF